MDMFNRVRKCAEMHMSASGKNGEYCSAYLGGISFVAAELCNLCATGGRGCENTATKLHFHFLNPLNIIVL